MNPPKPESTSAAKIGCVAAIAVALITVSGSIIVAYITLVSNTNNNRDARKLEIYNSNALENSNNAHKNSNLPLNVNSNKYSPEQSPTRELNPIRVRYINQIKIELLRTRMVGDEIQFELKLINESPNDVNLIVFGTDLYGHSKIIAGGQSYPASNCEYCRDARKGWC